MSARVNQTSRQLHCLSDSLGPALSSQVAAGFLFLFLSFTSFTPVPTVPIVSLLLLIVLHALIPGFRHTTHQRDAGFSLPLRLHPTVVITFLRWFLLALSNITPPSITSITALPHYRITALPHYLPTLPRH
ncbi:hypothetical protein F5B21DRAFT_95694 [Xylaria acuta]|nr:hypothetical protein F5B21DRAFT_95694 [Xylaria acuta]